MNHTGACIGPWYAERDVATVGLRDKNCQFQRKTFEKFRRMAIRLVGSDDELTVVLQRYEIRALLDLVAETFKEVEFFESMFSDSSCPVFPDDLFDNVEKTELPLVNLLKKLRRAFG